MEATNEIAAEMHPFELAGLGKAPFRVIGAAERTFQACPGAPVKAGGCCKFCYTGIRYAVIIKSSDGNVFDVGSECVRKVDVAAWHEYKKMRREELRAERARFYEEQAQSNRAARAAREAEIHAANEAAFRAREPELAACVDRLLPVDGFPGDAASRALSAIRACGDVHTFADECAHTARKLRELYYEQTATGHTGTVGKRETLRARYVGRHSFETHFGIKTVHKFAMARADGSHALLTWKTTSALLADDAHVELGAELTITASIAEHGEFRGLPQTDIKRPKFKRSE